MGTPRSGTTLLGEYIGSCASVCYLGEYAGFYLTLSLVPDIYDRIPNLYKERYLASLQEHALGFARDVAREKGCSFYCDATPWSLLCVPTLSDRQSNALFVLALRHYSGVLQSLERAYQAGWEMAGSTWQSRAELWAEFYGHALLLPPERTVVLSYDRLCAEPATALAELRSGLATHGLDPAELDDRVLATGHASIKEHHRPTIAVAAPAGVELRPIPSFDPERWSAEIDAQVVPVVAETDAALRRHFGDLYAQPAGYGASPPAMSRR